MQVGGIKLGCRGGESVKTCVAHLLTKPPSNPPPQPPAQSGSRQSAQGNAGLLTMRIELARLGEGITSRPDQPKRLLTLTQLEPKQEMRGIKFDRLLQKFQGKRKLLIVVTDARGQPGREPIRRRKHPGFLETIIGTRLFSRQQDVSAG